MRKFTLVLSFLVATIASAFAQTEYTLDMACQLTDIDPGGSRGRCLIFKAKENPNLEFSITMDEYLMSNHPKIVSDGSDKYKDITLTAPEGYEITACSFSFVSTASKATATVYLGDDSKSTNSTNTPETVVGDFSSNPANSVDFIMTSTYTISGYQGITIKDIKVTVKSTQVEGGDNEGEGEGGDNGDGNEGEGGDNGDGNEGEGGDGNEGEGGDNGDGNEGGDNGDGNEGEGGDNGDGNEGEGGEVEGGDNNEEGEDTSINDVEVEASQVIYDLTGRRVNEITKAGIYIINGKKVLVK